MGTVIRKERTGYESTANLTLLLKFVGNSIIYYKEGVDDSCIGGEKIKCLILMTLFLVMKKVM